MSVNRREFIQATTYAALATAVTSKLSGIDQPSAPPKAFDIDQSFAAFMKDLGESPSDGGGQLLSRVVIRSCAATTVSGHAWPSRQWRRASARLRSGRSAREQDRT